MLRQAFEESFQVKEIQRNVNGEREGSRGRCPFARHRQRSERSANFCRTFNKGDIRAQDLDAAEKADWWS